VVTCDALLLLPSRYQLAFRTPGINPL